MDGTNTVAGETIVGIISNGAGGGKLAIVKNGAGQWRLNGHNSFSGGVTLNAGILGFSVYDPFGTGTLTVKGGVLAAVNTTVSGTVANKIVVGGNFSTTQGNASPTVANNLTFSGSMDLGGATRTITTGAMGTYTGGTNILAFSGVISNGGLIKDGAGALTLSGNNTYTGDTTVTLGTLVLAAGSQTSFDIGAIGTNNKILGTAGGSEGINLNGNFVFNLTGAGTGLGNNWNIVDMMNFTPTYGGTFGVVGFTDNLDNTWSKLNGGITYTFSEGTGSLSVTAIPEPSTLAFLAISLSVVVCARLLRCRGRSGIRE